MTYPLESTLTAALLSLFAAFAGLALNWPSKQVLYVKCRIESGRRVRVQDAPLTRRRGR